MNFLDAAHQILKTAGQPLHYSDIAQQAITTGLITPKGQTPDATMGSRLYVDTKKEESLFHREGKGFFSLKPQSGQERVISQANHLNQTVIDELRQRLHEMPPDRFEVLVGELLNALGFEEESIYVEPYTNDGGIDVRGILHVGGLTRLNVAIQVKRWKHNIGRPIVQQIKGSLKTHEHGIIITTSGFSAGAIKEASLPGTTPISLVDGNQLIRLLVKYEIGISETRLPVYAIDEEWWNEMLGKQPGETTDSSPLPDSPPGYPIPIRAGKNQEYEALLLNPQGHVQWAGQTFTSVSTAAIAANKKQSTNGWKFWRYQHQPTGEWRWIDELRNSDKADEVI